MGTEITEEGMPEGMTPDQRKELLSKVKTLAAAKPATEATTESGSEAVPTGPTNSGADVNWDEYDIPFALLHFYKTATYRETPQGPKWVSVTDEFVSLTRQFNSHGKRLKDGTLLNLGEYLQEKLNDGRGWRAVAIQPAGMGEAGVLLQRQVPYILPDPVKLETDTEVEAPTDPELQQAEDAALNFMENEGLSTQLEKEAAAQTHPMVANLEQRTLAINPPARLPRGPENPVPVDNVGNVPLAHDAGVMAKMMLALSDQNPTIVDGFIERTKDNVADLPPSLEGGATH